MKHKVYFSFITAIWVLLAISPVQVRATTVSDTDLGIQVTFPERYSVVSSTSVHNKGRLSDDILQQMSKSLADSNISYIALNNSTQEEIDLEVLSGDSMATFTYLSDSEVLDIGERLLTGMKKMDGIENVELSAPTLYKHSQVKFLLIEGVNGDMRVSQYITSYNNKTYRIAVYNQNGLVNVKEATAFIDSIKFLEDPIDNRKSSPWEEIAIKAGAGALAGAMGVFPYLFYKKKKKQQNEHQ